LVELVVARSFGPPAATAECAVRFLQVGGYLVVSEPRRTPIVGRMKVSTSWVLKSPHVLRPQLALLCFKRPPQPKSLIPAAVAYPESDHCSSPLSC
jgi:hypothetical protein